MDNKEKLPLLEGQAEMLLLVPKNFLDKITEQQNKILTILSSDNPSNGQLGDYLSESEAKKVLGKKSTWFWNMRTSGQLTYTKVGNTVYYSRMDIIELLNKNKR
jgi:hypothetical protein